MTKQSTSWLKVISSTAALLIFLATLGAGAIETRVRVGNVEANVARVEKGTAETLRDVRAKLERIEQTLHEIHVELVCLRQRVEDRMTEDAR